METKTRRRAAAIAIAIGLAVAGCRGSENDRLVDIGADLQGLDGLSAEMYAQGLQDAASIALDSDGKVWVATAAFDDTGTDGVYVVPEEGAAPQRVIADVHTPLGLLWLGDTLYVAATGGVTAYSGFDGSEFAEHHAVVDLPDDVGEVNGLALSAGGRISLGVSAPCDSCTPTSGHSAAVLSFLPDGTDLRVDASGIRAPVGLTYFPGTDRLFVTMNQRDDLGDATPGDWLSIVEPGQDWGFPACYGQRGDTCAGTPSPLAELDPHAAVSGVAIVTGELGDTVGNAAVVAEWTKGVVLMVRLNADGSSATGDARPLLTGVQNPVAVALGPDGSLFVSDWTTGTIYRVTANSQKPLTAP